MNGNKVKALIETGVCTILSWVLILIGVFVSPLLVLMTILASVPMMYLGMRHGVKILTASLVLAVAITFLITQNIVVSLLLGLMNFLPGMVLGYTLRVRKTFTTIIFSGAAVLLLGMVLQLAMFNAMGDGNGIENTLNGVLENSRTQVLAAFDSMGNQLPAESSDIKNAVNQAVEMTREFVLLYLPAILIGMAVCMSYLFFMIGAFILHRTRPIRILYRPFWAIYAPKMLGYLGIVLYFVSFSKDITIWTASLQNMIALIYAYFTICGISLIDYKFRKKVPSGYLRGIVYLLVLFFGYLFVGMILRVMCILGVIDGVVGFRAREERIGYE